MEALPELAGEPAHDPPAGPGILLDRERTYAWKRPLFERAFAAFERVPPDHERRRAFDRFRADHSAWLDDYALFRALCDEQHWRSWREWPEDLRDRRRAALEEARDRLAREIAFFEWLQLVADEQWRRARDGVRALGVSLYGDLPFAPAQQSADVWANPDAFDLERTAGAPPDEFSATGQRWGLPMFAWEAQRASGFAFQRSRARRMRELYDVVRVDHVVGLFRTYGFRGADDEGAFDPVDEDRQIAQGREILELLRDELAPARLVAEDLGVIPKWVRETLRALDIPGYRIFRWEIEDEKVVPPSTYPECSLATTGTHDTDTLVSWWLLAEPEERERSLEGLGLQRALAAGPLDESTRFEILDRLWRSPSRYVVLPIQDLFGWQERVNVPATVGGANWRWRLPMPIAELPYEERILELVRRAKR